MTSLSKVNMKQEYCNYRPFVSSSFNAMASFTPGFHTGFTNLSLESKNDPAADQHGRILLPICEGSTLLNPFVSLIGTPWCKLIVLVTVAEPFLELFGPLLSLSSCLFNIFVLNGFRIIFAGLRPHFFEVVVFQTWGCTAEWRENRIFLDTVVEDFLVDSVSSNQRI